MFQNMGDINLEVLDSRLSDSLQKDEKWLTKLCSYWFFFVCYCEDKPAISPESFSLDLLKKFVLFNFIISYHFNGWISS